MLSLTSLIPLIPLLSTLVQSVEAFDYRSAIQGKTNRGDVPGRYVLEFDTSNDAKQVAKRDGGVSGGSFIPALPLVFDQIGRG